MTDNRSPIAKARDKWLSSSDARSCLEGVAEGQYLRNRLERAFIAGWDAKEQDARQEKKTK